MYHIITPILLTGTPLFDEESEHTSLLYNPKEKHGLVNECSLTTTGSGTTNSKIILQEYDYDQSEAKTYTEPSTNICLAICSTFFCFVVGMFAISHSVQAHYYKEVRFHLLSTQILVYFKSCYRNL